MCTVLRVLHVCITCDFHDGVHQSKTTMTDRQYDYGVQSDYNEDYIFTPTDQQIKTGKMDYYYWRINHSSTNHTHRLW